MLGRTTGAQGEAPSSSGPWGSGNNQTSYQPPCLTPLTVDSTGRPSKDNFWSTDGEQFWGPNGVPWASQPNPGTNCELNAVLAALSTGPVGPSDGKGLTNATRVMQSCAADGTLLQPNKPLTWVDSMLTSQLPGEETLKGHAHATYSEAPGTSMYYHVLTVNLTDPWGLRRTDLYPVPQQGQAFAVRDWHHSAACVDGGAAVSSGCITLAGSGSDLLAQLEPGVAWPTSDKTLRLHTVSPVTVGKWGFLGELGKYRGQGNLSPSHIKS